MDTNTTTETVIDGEGAGTVAQPTTTGETPAANAPAVETKPTNTEKTFTQDQVNAIVKRDKDKALKDLEPEINRLKGIENQFNSWAELGDFESVKTKLEQADAILEEKRVWTNEKAAALVNFDADELQDFVTDKNLSIEINEIEGEGGKKSKIPYIGDKPLLDYVKESHPKRLKSLQLEGNSNGGSWITQPSNSEGQSKPVDTTGNYLNSKYQRPDKKQDK